MIKTIQGLRMKFKKQIETLKMTSWNEDELEKSKNSIRTLQLELSKYAKNKRGKACKALTLHKN